MMNFEKNMFSVKLHKPINEAGAVGEKQVFGSEGMVAGKGCQTFAFVRLGICFFLFSINR